MNDSTPIPVSDTPTQNTQAKINKLDDYKLQRNTIHVLKKKRNPGFPNIVLLTNPVPRARREPKISTHTKEFLLLKTP